MKLKPIETLMKDKKGQPVFVGLMIFIAVIITAIAMIPLLKQVLTEARDADHLDCDNPSIDDFKAATCIVTDLTFLYFIGTVIAAAGGFMWWRRGQA